MYVINRSVAILKPNQPFLDWLAEVPDPEPLELTLGDLRHDCTALLIPDFDDEADALGYIYASFEELFEMELDAWYNDESLWPADRTLEMFEEWFDIEIHSMVTDMAEDEFAAEDFDEDNLH